MADTPQPSAVLVILDGWGYSETYEGNAIAQAQKPNFDRLWNDNPHTLLQASGEAVGLPWGEMGNSEVGHMNLGAGRVVPQDLPRVSAAVSDESFYSNQALVAACQHVIKTKGTLNLVGLASTGGVHSHLRHLIALLELAKRQGVSTVHCHIFTDGRDAPPKAAKGPIAKLEEEMKARDLGRIASVSGRYYAMDRDRHWDRTKLAFEAIAEGKGQTAPTAEAAIQQAYDEDFTDEFIVPTVIADKDHPAEHVREEDAIIFFNFRPDRIRQLTEAFVRTDFDKFDRDDVPQGIHYVTMTQYQPTFPVHVAFQPLHVEDNLAKVVSDAGLRQFHIAETEKYPHATYFLNGGHEEPYPMEERLLIPSPKVPTYDQEPAMSAEKITDELCKRIKDGDYPFIMANYANADMVGHSRNIEATIKAVSAIDQALGRLATVCNESGTFLLITADHGNAEQMIDFKTGEPDPEHTTNPVPFILQIPKSASDSFTYDTTRLNLDPKATATGLLGDVAPTVLNILGIKVPDGMEGFGLL
ncbi:2,3-bisphosphoglycerate-independent phosphoglycerate mutase [Patescibacteria group bacterium]|nr:2,3-bisphosphoglycerate-independent phosphoglycerate mutase [Patescibacteria group bacterium]